MRVRVWRIEAQSRGAVGPRRGPELGGYEERERQSRVRLYRVMFWSRRPDTRAVHARLCSYVIDSWNAGFYNLGHSRKRFAPTLYKGQSTDRGLHSNVMNLSSRVAATACSSLMALHGPPDLPLC